jgi:hypothetical protein
VLFAGEAVRSADALPIQDYHRMRKLFEDKYAKVRVPAGNFANKRPRGCARGRFDQDEF